MSSNTVSSARPAAIRWHPVLVRSAPVLVIVAAIIVIWYVAAILMNLNIVRDAFEREDTSYTAGELIAGTLNAERPLLPAPHQIVETFADDVFGWPVTSPRSLVYHSWVTLSATFLGFLLGASFGVLLAVLIVHVRSLKKSLLPWIICSQMVPILAVAPIVIVVLGSIGLRGLLPKAIISAYLCFFPVTIGVVKGLNSPDPIQRDLMQTWSATPSQIFWKLRWPSSVPFLFTSLKVSITISLIGAIVAELPTGAQAGIGARLLAGSYYGQTVQIWAALVAASILAVGLIGLVGGREVGGAGHGSSSMTVRPKKEIPALGIKWHRAILFLAALAMLAALIVPISNETTAGLLARPGLLVAALLAAALYASAAFLPLAASIVVTFAGVLLGCCMTLALLNDTSIAGSAAWGFWLAVLADWGAAWLAVARLASFRPHGKTASRAFDLAIPLLFGAFVFYLWEVTVRGFGVPPVLFPPPSLIAVRFFGSLWTLWQDFFQTFILGVLSGYVIGCGAGFIVAIIAHRYTFLGRGLLPIGNFVSALPIVGIAPIMVMWFGFDWPSKAAVVVVITFFPMLVNTLAGLNATGHIERDLMRSYGAAPGQTLRKLYLPAAMPFIFNALKINSTLAFIGAIVAEFFGTPTVGIGFRISIEAGRMALDMVWAEIALAAIAGMAFYGIVALAERATTFWHPSYRT